MTPQYKHGLHQFRASFGAPWRPTEWERDKAGGTAKHAEMDHNRTKPTIPLMRLPHHHITPGAVL